MTCLETSGFASLSSGTASSSIRHVRRLAYAPKGRKSNGVAIQVQYILTHIEKGTVTVRRVTKVIKMIVVEYGGRDRGRGSACARSRNPSESSCIKDIFRRDTFTGACWSRERLWVSLSRVVLVANIESTFSATFDASATRHLRSITCYSRQFCGQVFSFIRIANELELMQSSISERPTRLKIQNRTTRMEAA